MITTSKSVKLLDFNEPIFDYTDPKEILHYQLKFNPKDKSSLYFTRHFITEDVVDSGVMFYIGSDLMSNHTMYEYPFQGEDNVTKKK